MAEKPPVVYLLHGEDLQEIDKFVSSLTSRLGDALVADINTTRLDGRVVSLDEVETVTRTMPFMTKRRVVIFRHPLARLTTPASRERLKAILNKAPDSTALVLVEEHLLVDEKERKKKGPHWLEKWAADAGTRVLLRAYPTPQGPLLIRRIQEMAQAAGGKIAPQAAAYLASLVGDNLHILDLEVQKLVAYTNYQNQVEREDVEHLTADHGLGDVFTLVDAIGNREGRKAMEMLHRLLAAQDALSIFAMIVRQFRFILLAREIIDEGGQSADVARQLKLHTYVAEKAAAQARHFSPDNLAEIYHHLVELEAGIKSSEIEGSLALDTFIAGIANPPPSD